MPHLTLLDKGTLKSHRVDSTDALIGRDPASAIYVDGEAAKTVSARHARFFLAEGKWYVEDAGSRNGTFIGTRKLESGVRHALNRGEVVGLGLTGTQLLIQEVVGRTFASTLAEPQVGPTGERPSLTVAMPRGNERSAPAIPVPNLPPPPPPPSLEQEVRFVMSTAKGAIRVSGQSDRISIGRALECLIRIEGEAATSVSRLHAEVVLTEGQILLRDTGSRHGTYVNAKKIEGPVPVKRGDQITFGPIGQGFVVEVAALVPAGSTPTAMRPSAALYNPDDAYQSELPTPPLPQYPVRTNKEAVEPPLIVRSAPRINRSGANPSRSAANASRIMPPPQLPTVASSNRKGRLLKLAVGGAAALALLIIVGFVAYTTGQNRRAADSSAVGSTAQQASTTGSAELTKATQVAAAARAALDSASNIGASDPAGRAALDSLRRLAVAADEQVRKAGGRP